MIHITLRIYDSRYTRDAQIIYTNSTQKYLIINTYQFEETTVHRLAAAWQSALTL